MDALVVVETLAGACLAVELANSALLGTLLVRFGRAARKVGMVLQSVVPRLLGRTEGLSPPPRPTPPGTLPTPVPPAPPVGAVDPTWTPVKTSAFMAAKGYQTYRTPAGKLANVRVRDAPPAAAAAPAPSDNRWAPLEAMADRFGISPEDVMAKVGEQYGVDLGAMASASGEAASQTPALRGSTPAADPLEAMIPRLMSGEPLSPEEKVKGALLAYRKLKEPSNGSGESVAAGDWWT